MTNGTNATNGVSNVAFSAVILAGGKSSRMGRDKAFVEVGGSSLIARQIALVGDVGAGEVFISGREDVDYSAFGCRVLVDEFSDAGPLAGIERALDASSSPLVLVLAVDMPAMNSPMLRRLLASCTAVRGVIPRTKDGIEPLAAIYPKAALNTLKRELQQGKSPGVRWLAQECVAAGLAQFVDVSDADVESFVSVNSPEELRKLTG
jgi:molybdopterin-guanine dinucleotide biosynthesis protein A